MLPSDSPLRDRTYRRLFAAQLVALAGTGLLTVALALLAFDLEPGAAGQVLGTVLALKMVAYIVVSLLSTEFVARVSPSLSPRRLLVILDFARAALALTLPFVTALWQVYVLITVLSACSAAFKPVFQATLPAVLGDTERYTRALSLTRLAYDLENVLSPALAAALMLWMDSRLLFVGTAVGFVLSAVWIAATTFPADDSPGAASPRGSIGAAARSFVRTPRLRGLVALNLCVASVGAMVIVNGVQYIRGFLGLGETDLAIAMMASGAGSMLVALLLPRLLRSLGERKVMVGGAVGTSLALFVGWFGLSFGGILALWFVLGAGMALIQTPMGRVLTQSTHPEQRPAAFAMQFSASHACWLVTYLLAAWLPNSGDGVVAFVVLGALALAAALSSLLVWPSQPDAVPHTHALPASHPHVANGGEPHCHDYIIDALHPRWPKPV